MTKGDAHKIFLCAVLLEAVMCFFDSGAFYVFLFTANFF